MFAPVLITAPAVVLVSASEAKAHLRVDHSEEDSLITSIVSAVTAHLDGWTGVLGRALVTQTWRQDYEAFEDRLRLPLWPVASVTSVTYRDDEGADQTVSASNYTLLRDDLGAYVEIKPGLSWPEVGDHLAPVSVTYVAGQAAADVPAAIKHAAYLMIGDLYRNRETAAIGVQATAIPMSATVNALLAPYRRVNV